MPVDLILAAPGVHCVGSTVRVDIRLVSTPAERIQAADIVFGWDTSKLRLVGVDAASATLPNLMTGLPPASQDYTGTNEADPPADGTAILWWLSPLNGIPTMCDDDIAATIVFEALAPFASTEVALIPTITVAYQARTIVYGSNVPGSNVTGALTPATVIGCPCDLDGDNQVGAFDLALELADWRSGSADRLAAILSDWGSCGSP
jgi:hypothetical protein